MQITPIDVEFFLSNYVLLDSLIHYSHPSYLSIFQLILNQFIIKTTFF